MENREKECKQDAGVFKPIIDRNRCEGKEDCLRVCPYDVFTIGTLQADDRKNLSIKGKIKGWTHKWRQAFTTNEEACHNCGLCVSACPEKAITLGRV